MMTRPTKQTKLIFPSFTKLFIDHYLSTNKSIPQRSDADMYVEGQDLPLLKLINIVDGDLKFRLEIQVSMINDPLNSQPDTSTTKIRRINETKKGMSRASQRNMRFQGRKEQSLMLTISLKRNMKLFCLQNQLALRNRDVNNKGKKLKGKWEKKNLIGEGSSPAKDGEFEDFSNIDSNATARSSWSNTDKDDDIVNAKKFDIDICDDDSDKGDDDAT
ncbi:hypothetical protein Tco_0385437 [Tanacetum coccineum]